MNRTRETITPTEALKLVAQTLNNPSIRHERIDMTDVFNATAAVVAGNTQAKILTITIGGVVIQGLVDVLAAVHAWKPVTFDVARGVRGERAYVRKGPAKAPEFVLDETKIRHSLDLLRDTRK